MATDIEQAPQTDEDVVISLLFEIFGDELLRPEPGGEQNLDADAAERCPSPPKTEGAADEHAQA